MNEQKAMISVRDVAARLGGCVHGPMVETLSIPLEKLGEFLDVLRPPHIQQQALAWEATVAALDHLDPVWRGLQMPVRDAVIATVSRWRREYLEIRERYCQQLGTVKPIRLTRFDKVTYAGASLDGEPCEYYDKMDECPTGEWVRYADVIAVLNGFKETVLKARRVWLEENPEDTGTDHVTPFDQFLYLSPFEQAAENAPVPTKAPTGTLTRINAGLPPLAADIMPTLRAHGLAEETPVAQETELKGADPESLGLVAHRLWCAEAAKDPVGRRHNKPWHALPESVKANYRIMGMELYRIGYQYGVNDTTDAVPLDAIVGKIKTAQGLIDTIQRSIQHGSALWHQLETVDDLLHEALGALGD